MHSTETPTPLAALLEQGEQALRAGDTIEARNLFRQITEADPQNAAAWLGIARSVRPYQEKRNLLLRVLELEPDHQAAQTMLAEVEARIAAGDLLAPRILPSVPEGTPATEPAEPEVSYCYRHSDRETLLHCIQCDKPICVECVRPAAVGQLCPDCAQQRRPRNYQVTPKDTIIAAIAAIGAGFLATLGMLLFVLNIPFFGIIIAFIAAPRLRRTLRAGARSAYPRQAWAEYADRREYRLGVRAIPDPLSRCACWRLHPSHCWHLYRVVHLNGGCTATLSREPFGLCNQIS